MVSSILRAFAAFAHEPRNDSAQKCSERRAGGIYEHIGDKAGAPGDKILNDLVRDRGEGADGKRNGKAVTAARRRVRGSAAPEKQHAADDVSIPSSPNSHRCAVLRSSFSDIAGSPAPERKAFTFSSRPPLSAPETAAG